MLGRWINQDPSGDWGGWNIYTFSKNSPTNFLDYLGLDPSLTPGGPAPVINDDPGPPLPLTPNAPGNCYSYACNRPGNNHPLIPGRDDHPFPDGEITCESVVSGVKRDHPEAVSPDEKDCCPEGMHKISVFVSKTDFHFHRQDSGGGWSHKPGPQPPQFINSLINPNITPNKNPDYDKFCEYLCVNN